jgi:hypothetical protein
MRWPKEGNVAEAAEVHIAENSPEEVAFKLLYEIAEAEGMQMRLADGPKSRIGNGYLTHTLNASWP